MKNKYDELVNDFVLSKWRERWSDFKPHSYHEHNRTRANIKLHLLECRTTRVSVREAGWECGCYSEYTREDFFEMEFSLSCGCGCYYSMVESINLGDEYGSVIEQLEEYESTRDCPYDDYNYEDD